MKDQISIGSPKLWAELERRACGERPEAEVAIWDLARYYHLLARVLDGLTLTEQEAMLIWRALTQASAAHARQGKPDLWHLSMGVRTLPGGRVGNLSRNVTTCRYG
jgi:hypothetical protein